MMQETGPTVYTPNPRRVECLTVVVMDNASSNSLFNHFASGDTVPVLYMDKAHSFLMKISSFSKSQQANLTMERLCKCFDSGCWYMLKGNKGKWTGVPSARA